MSNPNVLIVEDEFVISTHLKYCLEEIGCNIVDQVIRAEEALKVLEAKHIDLILLDIKLKGEKDGIFVGQKIKETYSIPFIYLTSHADKATVDQAIKTRPSGYIVKPFKKNDIYTSVRLALEETSETELYDSQPIEYDKETDPFLFIKHEGLHVKILFQDIIYIRGVGNYIEIHTLKKNYLIKGTMKDMLKKLRDKHFLKVHKSYIVNFSFLESFNKNYIFLQNEKIPIGRNYQENVFKYLAV
jgi:two-component system, LytTR family, response regulator LytT